MNVAHQRSPYHTGSATSAPSHVVQGTLRVRGPGRPVDRRVSARAASHAPDRKLLRPRGTLRGPHPTSHHQDRPGVLSTRTPPPSGDCLEYGASSAGEKASGAPWKFQVL
ncbi:hypothetical protein MRX96_024465 [Rhipicephalus microplus]